MYKILTKLGKSDYAILPLWILDPKWRSEEIPKAHKYGVALLSLTYFCQLFIFKYKDKDNFKIGDEVTEYHAKLWLFLGTLCGAIIAYCLLSFFRKQRNKKSIHWVILLSNLLLTISFCIYIENFNKFKLETNWFYFLRFSIGFFNASCIGLSITWICENLFKHLRTTGTVYFGLIGFLGALIVSWVEPNKYDTYIYSVLFILLILHLYNIFCSKAVLTEAKLVTIFFSRERKSPWPEIWENRKEIFFSLLLGMTVQYWTFWAGDAEGLFYNTKKDDYSLNISFYRYLGVVIGSVFLVLWFKKAKVRRRDDVLFWALLLTFVVNVGLLIFGLNPFKVDFWVKELTSLQILSILIGMLSSVWVLSVLHIAESFNLRFRPFMIILAPNVYRASEMILLWRTHGNESNNFTAVHSWGFMFAILGIAAVLVLKKDKFEADALDTAVDKEGKIDNAKISGDIHKIPEREESIFFEKANNLIYSHLGDNVQMKFYLSAIYYKSSNTEKITHSKYRMQDDVLACYSNMSPEKAENAHVISTKLVDIGTHESYINFLFAKPEFHGGLMFRPGRTGRKTLKEGFKQFKLNVIDLSEYMPDAKSLKETREVLESGKHESLSNIDFRGIVKSDFSDNLKQTFGLFAADASYYNPEAYFLYLIKPISANIPRPMLVVKTSDELSEDNLRRLQHLISTVLGKWDEILSTRDAVDVAKSLLKLSNRTIHHHFIKRCMNLLVSNTDLESELNGKSNFVDKIINQYDAKNADISQSHSAILAKLKTHHKHHNTEIKDHFVDEMKMRINKNISNDAFNQIYDCYLENLRERYGFYKKKLEVETYISNVFASLQDANNHEIKLSDEINFIRNLLIMYSKIKEYSDYIEGFNDIDSIIKVDSSSKEPDKIIIPRFISQPLVENAIMYGSKYAQNRRDTGQNKDFKSKVSILYTVNDDSVILHIENHGPIQNEISTADNSSIGLIRTHLKNFYNKEDVAVKPKAIGDKTTIQVELIYKK